MNKRSLLLYLVFILFIPFIQSSAQDIEVVLGDTTVYGSPGVLELVLYMDIINISSTNQTVFLVRTENNLPADWTTSLCFGVNCYPPMVDSVSTTDPVLPGDTIEASVHFYPDLTTPGTGNVQVQIGTEHNPALRTTVNLLASTEPSAVNEEEFNPYSFKLMQNYPNPFNPTTLISYTIPQRSEVNIKVYNITGQEVADLVNEVKDPGTYKAEFDAGNLSSGIYFYKITAGRYSAVRKMMLIK